MGLSFAAPLAGRDSPARPSPTRRRHFNPRAPCGARLQHDFQRRQLAVISIHAPLAGRDCQRRSCAPRPRHFNPRAPCGARLPDDKDTCVVMEFQSTYPLRGATGIGRADAKGKNFNPRAPCGARRGGAANATHIGIISIHAPLAGRDAVVADFTKRRLIFQSTRPLRGATKTVRLVTKHGKILSTRPLRGATISLSFAQTVPSFQSTRPLRGATIMPPPML